MGYLYYVSMLLVVSVMCRTTVTQSQNESCRNINYQVSHLHQVKKFKSVISIEKIDVRLTLGGFKDFNKNIIL